MANLCDNCGNICTDEQLITPIPHLAERLYPGGTVPSGECPECGSLAYPVTTAEEVGNQFGHLCPACNKGDGLTVNFIGTCRLFPSGTDDEGDHEWDSNSQAQCNCGWFGHVRDFKEVENFEET